MDKELMKGSIDILLLSMLKSRDCYGYEMTKELRLKSMDSYTMNEGTLYPALKRLEKKRLIESYWNAPDEGKQRKYYTLTDDGEKELEKKLSHWKKIDHLIQKCSEGFS